MTQRTRASSDSGTPPERALGPADRLEQRRARLALLGVAVLYVLVHALFAGFARALNWDEAIHLSQVVPGRSTVFLEPHRTRGVSLLVAPVAVFDPPTLVLRAYLAVMGAAGIFMAFSTWIRSVGFAAPLAALLFVSYRVTTFYGVEVLPNLPTALLCIAIGGLAATAVTEDGLGSARPPNIWLVAGVMFLLALVRPPDAVLIGVGLAIAVTVLRPRVAGWFVPSAAVGGALGLVPWFVEGAVRFGLGPLDLVRSGGDYSTNVAVFNRFPIIVRSLEDTLRCGHRCEQAILESGSPWALPGWRTTTFVLVCLALVVVAAVMAGPRRRPALVAAILPVPLLLFYSFSTLINMRYLMPVFAAWLLPPAVGAVATWRAVRGQRWAPAVHTVSVLLLVSAVWWQWGSGIDRLQDVEGRQRARQLGLAVAQAADGAPCAVAASTARPMIQYYSGCETVELVDGEDDAIQDPLGELNSYVDLAQLHAEGYRIFALRRGMPSSESPIAAWARTELEGGRVDGFMLLEHRPGDPLPSAPCPPPDGPKRMLGAILSDTC